MFILVIILIIWSVFQALVFHFYFISLLLLELQWFHALYSCRYLQWDTPRVQATDAVQAGRLELWANPGARACLETKLWNHSGSMERCRRFGYLCQVIGLKLISNLIYYVFICYIYYVYYLLYLFTYILIILFICLINSFIHLSIYC